MPAADSREPVTQPTIVPGNELAANAAGLYSRIRYRIAQFLRGLRSHFTAGDLATVSSLLAADAWQLFSRMPKDAQTHSVNVLRTLQDTGDVPADLAVAALLHDVGKVAATDAGAYLGLWLRGPLVLFEAIHPQWLHRWADDEPSSSPRYALYVQLEHPRIGAAWARQAGCSELTCWLIEHHQDTESSGRGPKWEMLARLQWADGRN